MRMQAGILGLSLLAFVAGAKAISTVTPGQAAAKQDPAKDPDQRPGPPGTFRVRVRLVPVDVIVTDQRNRPVTDLKAEEFEVYDNGRLQEIRHFSMQTFTETAVQAAPQPPLKAPAPAVTLTPQSSRTFLILMGRGWHQRLKAVDSLIRFVRNDLLPQDRVALFAYNRATDFTPDHERIAQALERYKTGFERIESWLESRNRGLAVIYGSKEIPKAYQDEIDTIFQRERDLASRQVPPATQGKNPRQDAKVAQLLTHELAKQMADTVADPGQSIAASENELAAMEALRGSIPFDEWAPLYAGASQDMQNILTCIDYLRYMEGEKHLLFFTEQGLILPFGNVDNDDLIARAANDARVAIDTFQTGGIYLDMGIRRGPVNLRNTPLSSPGRNDALAGLRNISQLTGGRAAIYSDIGTALKTVNETSRVEYLLGYYPAIDKWDGQYRNIQVKVKRPGLKVSYRHGYFARDKLQPYDREEFLAYSRISAAGGYEREIGDVPFNINANRVTDASGQALIRVDLLIEASGLVIRSVDGRHRGKLRIAIFYADARQKFLGQEWKNVELNLTEPTFRMMLASRIPFSILIPLRGPDQHVKVVVYDVPGDKVGSKLIRVR